MTEWREVIMELNEKMKDGVLEVSRCFNQHGRYAALIKIRDLQKTLIEPNIEGIIQTTEGRNYIRDMGKLEDELDNGNVAPEKFVALSIGFSRLVNGEGTRQ